jgi:hypothetical protein
VRPRTLIGSLPSTPKLPPPRMRSVLRLKIILALGLLLALLGAMAAYVAIPVMGELRAARAILNGPVAELGDDDLGRARSHLDTARDRLDGIAASILGFVPVASQNVGAVRDVVDSILPVLNSATALRTSIDEVLNSDIADGGRIDLEALDDLVAPLFEQRRTLGRLVQELRKARNGWLYPTVWDEVDEVLQRAEDLYDSVSKGAEAIRLLRPMFGAEGPRAYLVILMNNSELRGAGGILSGAGVMTVDNGRLELGKFDYTVDLRGEKPFKEVASPVDFDRRFSRYRADKTVWVNTTASPDIPEVALVASRLYDVSAGITVDGAIIIDPIGIQSLLPEDATLKLPGTHERIAGERLAQYVYAESYARLGGEDPRRRLAILGLGREALELALKDGAADRSALDSIAEAISGGHLSLFSMNLGEQEVLERIGAARPLRSSTQDSLLVTVQNFGADKLDYYMERSLKHHCEITEVRASCSSTITLANASPLGLPPYVVQTDKPSYAFYEGYLEIYIPQAAEVSFVELDSEPVTFFPEVEDHRRSIGMMFGVPRGQSITAEVVYELPLDGSYSLQIDPQPLAHEAGVNVELDLPAAWLTRGPGGETKGPLKFEGTLSGSLKFQSSPDGGRTGLSALWWRLRRFWSEPLF